MQIQLKKEVAKSFIISTLGITILGLSISLISWRFKLVTSGLPGYALIFNYLTHVSVGTALLIGNTVILILSFLIAGKTAGIKGIYGYMYLSLIIDLPKQLFGLSQINTPSFPLNILLYIIQGTIAAGAIGFVIQNNYSFGSYSSMLPIADKFIKVSPAVFMFILDIFLTLVTTYFFGLEKGIFLLINATAFFFSLNYTLKLLNKKFKHPSVV